MMPTNVLYGHVLGKIKKLPQESWEGSFLYSIYISLVTHSKNILII